MKTYKMVLGVTTSELSSELIKAMVAQLGEPKWTHRDTTNYTKNSNTPCGCCDGGFSKSAQWSKKVYVNVDPCTSYAECSIPVDCLLKVGEELGREIDIAKGLKKSKLDSKFPVLNGEKVYYSYDAPTAEQRDFLVGYFDLKCRYSTESLIRTILVETQSVYDVKVSYEGYYLIEVKFEDYKMVLLHNSGSGSNGNDVHLSNKIKWLQAIGFEVRKTFISSSWKDSMVRR